MDDRFGRIEDRESQRVCERTRRRERKHSQEEVEVLKFCRDLEWLANRYPRFRRQLRALVFYARLQLQSEKAHRDSIVRTVTYWGRVSSSEIMDDVKLDIVSVRRALASELGPSGRLERVTREGAQLVIRANGRPIGEPYYRLRRAESEAKAA